jgi:hypothetical protein
LQFVEQHPGSKFLKDAEELESRVIKLITELFLTRRNQIRHPNPDLAVPLDSWW